MRANRIDKQCPLTDGKVIDKKEQRGYMQTTTSTTECENLIVTRWKNIAVVTVGSTMYGQNPAGTTTRWS